MKNYFIILNKIRITKLIFIINLILTAKTKENCKNMGIATAKRNIGNKATTLHICPYALCHFYFYFWAFFQSVSYFDNNFFTKRKQKATKSKQKAQNEIKRDKKRYLKYV